MTTTTCLARGYKLSRQDMADRWMGYINGGNYPDDQQELLVNALCAAQEDEFDAMLPDGCSWHPHTSEIIGPVGTDLEEDLTEQMVTAAEAVTARYEEIEAEVLGVRLVEELTAAINALPPLQRARIAGDVIDASQGPLAAVRWAAIAEASKAGMSQDDIAEALDISQPQVHRLLAAHRKTLIQEDQ